MADKVKVVEIDQVREKLIELIDECSIPVRGAEGHLMAHYSVRGDEAEYLADHLIANDVTVQRWIPVTERLPEEHDSIFAKFFGTERWINGMFRTTSNDVIACVEYEDGTRDIRTMRTIDGKWNFKGMGGKKTTHWMPLPEPPKGE